MIFICGVLCFSSILHFSASADTSQVDPQKEIQRIASLVEYVAADYQEAISKDGSVLDPAEYSEQKELLEAARNQTKQLQADPEKQKSLLAKIELLQKAVLGKRPPSEIQTLARAVRVCLQEEFQLRMHPSEHVDLSSAQPLYQMHCASCHGLTGHADTPTAAVLKPAPVSFHDTKRMAEISPALAYHTLTFGVSGTGMASFDFLSPKDRWNLAFYVIGLRHASVPVENVASIAQKVAPLAKIQSLAEKSDAELIKEIATISSEPKEQSMILAYLRNQIFSQVNATQSQKHFVRLEQTLNELLNAATNGENKHAYDLSVSAYLDEFEPYEGLLRAKDADIVTKLEGLFQELRTLTKQTPIPVQKVQGTVDQIRNLLLQAEHILDQGSTQNSSGEKQHSFWSLFAPILGITLREGFEVMLLVSFLLAYLRKSGQANRAPVVHAGWVGAIVAGFATYIISYILLKQAFSGQKRELIEAISTFLALAILLPLTHSILGAKEARHWLGFLGKRLDSVKQPTGPMEGSQTQWFKTISLFAIAFFAVYREMVETILFYRPYLEEGGWASQKALGAGVLLGVSMIAGVALFISYTGKRLNPRPVMQVSSFFLGLICISMAGQGVHALQEAGIIGSYDIILFGHKLPGVSWLGIYPNWLSVSLQLIVLAILLLPLLLKRRKDASPKVSA